jgi:hypothetical protein
MKHNLNAEIRQWKEQVLLWNKDAVRNYEEEVDCHQQKTKLTIADWSVDEIMRYASVRIAYI